MKIKIQRLLLLVGCTTVLASTAHSKESCALAAPPRAAAVNVAHGEFLFIYPRGIGENYSGCQTMWNQRGSAVFVLRFEQGMLASYQEFTKSSHKATLSCKYSGAALKTRSSKCPAYEDVQAGFRTMPEAAEPRVPTDVDPRRD
jgi:hypothetical protein